MIVRLAIGGSYISTRRAFLAEYDPKPAILVSFEYWPCYKGLHGFHYRDLAIDSGAFSALSKGKTIHLGEYVNFCRERLLNPTVVDVFSLDVIGDAAATIRNTDAMWKNGIPAIPTYHYGQPLSALDEIAERFPKIALGGAARLPWRKKLDWAQACFDRVYPKAIHGFGFGAEQLCLGVPFHSVDASSWEFGPRCTGGWKAFAEDTSVKYLDLRGRGCFSLRAEIEWYLELERRASHRWRGEADTLAELNQPYERAIEDARARAKEAAC